MADNLIARRETQYAPKKNENMHMSDFGIKTKPYVPTMLENIKSRSLDVRVIDGLVESKSSLMSTTHYLTFLIDVP